jgi:hypothetical protein
MPWIRICIRSRSASNDHEAAQKQTVQVVLKTSDSANEEALDMNGFQPLPIRFVFLSGFIKAALLLRGEST